MDGISLFFYWIYCNNIIQNEVMICNHAEKGRRGGDKDHKLQRNNKCAIPFALKPLLEY